MKWGLIYGIILCAARALGEFGAVNALSKTRGETFTLPLEIDALYMSGTDTSVTASFAVSSLLVILAIVILFVRNVLEHRDGKEKKYVCRNEKHCKKYGDFLASDHVSLGVEKES